MTTKFNSRWHKTIALAALLGTATYLLAGATNAAITAVPAVIDHHAALPNFTQYRDVTHKKTAFFNYLAPIAAKENQRVSTLRQRIKQIPMQAVSAQDQAFLVALAATYRVALFAPERAKDRQRLLAKVDQLPVALTLSQAANESAWGTSRFAREANNLFGEWCFSRGCGVVPARRSAGLTHEVATFATPEKSLQSYILNINRGSAYSALRAIRADTRQQGKEPTAHQLAGGLSQYSERGEKYVEEIRQMIKYNHQLMAESIARAE